MSLVVPFLRIIACLALFTTGPIFGMPLSEWEGMHAEDELENSDQPRGFVDDTMIPVPDRNLDEETNPLLEVSLAPKKQMQADHKKSHIDLAKVPVSAISTKNIKDETAITGENARKQQLPEFIKRGSMQTPELLMINQVTYDLYKQFNMS